MQEKRYVNKPNLRALKPDNKGNEKEQNQDNMTTIEGYGLLFNTLSKDLGGFKEKISSNSLNNVDLSKVYMLFNHNYDQPLASVEAGNLELSIDDKGLKFVAKLDNSVSYVNDVVSQVNNGNIKNCSFSFDMDIDDDNAELFSEENGETIRTINKIKNVFDVSLVTIPAYDQTTVKVDKRSYNNYKNEGVENPEMKRIKQGRELETRGFMDYVKTRGEKRDGITTANMGALVPNSIIKEIKDLNLGKLDLKSRVDVRQVPTGNGSLPLVDSGAIAYSKEELAANPELKNDVKTIDYKTNTYAGEIALSSEFVEDSAEVNIKQALVKDMATIATNTYNDKIAKELNNQQTTTVKDLDSIRQEVLTLDPRFKKEILMDTNMYSYVKTLKDNTGKYLVEDDTILGLPITVTNLVKGAVIGDLNSAVVLFDRNNTTVNWQKFDSYSEGLALILRLDVKIASSEAIKHINLDTTDNK